MLKKIIMVLAMVIAAGRMAAAQAKEPNLFAYPREAPQTSFYRADGTEFRLSDFKGSFVLVVFWSRTCLPCVRELDNLREFMDKTRDTGIKVILISKAGEWDSATQQRQFIKKFKGPSDEFYVDYNGRLASDFGIFAYPHTVMINMLGEEIGRIRGAVEWDDDDIIEYIYKVKAEHGSGQTETDD